MLIKNPWGKHLQFLQPVTIRLEILEAPYRQCADLKLTVRNSGYSAKKQCGAFQCQEAWKLSTLISRSKQCCNPLIKKTLSNLIDRFFYTSICYYSVSGKEQI